MMLQTINKHTVLKQVRTTGTWMGYIAPNKVNGAHITGGWHLGHDIIISIGRDNEYYVVSTYELDFTPLDNYLNNFKFYNCHNELGKTVRFWEGK